MRYYVLYTIKNGGTIIKDWKAFDSLEDAEKNASAFRRNPFVQKIIIVKEID